MTAWVDRLEKFGRLVLWLAIASAFVFVPIRIARQRSEEAELRDALGKAEERAAEALARKPSGPTKLPLSLMRPYLTAVVATQNEGKVWFTNVSSNAGFLCVRGTVNNPTTGKKVQSIPACQAVPAYGSAMSMSLMFPGDLEAACPKAGDCSLALEDAAETG